MQLVNGSFLFSATDLLGYLDCVHLTHLDFEFASGDTALAPERTDAAELVARKGDEHEHAYLESLHHDGAQVVEIERPLGPEGLGYAAQQTLDAMAAGVEVIHGGVLFDGEHWHGYTDFLERVDGRSAFGDWAYEVADTKLARRIKPYFLLQLCQYSDLLSACQGVLPQRIHVILGTRARESFLLADFSAYYRSIRRQFEAMIASGASGTYPEPVEHCGVCRWQTRCAARWEADDHLSLVAGMRKGQRKHLAERGIKTVAQLGTATARDRPARIGAATFETLRQQARLQLRQRDSGAVDYELLPLRERRGLFRLPAPSEGDIFFDIEGDPYFDDGLEYLFGVVYFEGEEPQFRSFWATDRDAEKRAFEDFVDFAVERLRRFPAMHIYHYASYEPTALKRLMGLHSTREEEVDELLRREVLVDLYAVVRESLRISQPSYSIKALEPLYMEKRSTEVEAGGESIIWFERYLDTGDRSVLTEIEQYNEADCHSTHSLRRWLLDRRKEAIERFDCDIAFKQANDPGQPHPQARVELDGRRAALSAGLSEDRGERDDDQQALWLLAQLLDYHRREAKPQWWAYFTRRDTDEHRLIEEDTEALGGLTDSGAQPRRLPPPARSLAYRLCFPPQDHKVSAGSFVDPATESAVMVESIDDAQGVLEIRRATTHSDQPLPTALIPGGPYDTQSQQGALARLADDVIANGLGTSHRYGARCDILCRRPPRMKNRGAGETLQAGEFNLEDAKALCEDLDQSYLFIQGPPGSGKTYTAAKLVCHMLGGGFRIGVAAASHAAIHNLLHQIEGLAPPNPDWRGLKKQSGRDNQFHSKREDGVIENSNSIEKFASGDYELVAGTAWLFAREEMDATLDYLFVDEAGQLALADALAIAAAGRNLILLGDPLQLAQVSQAIHPPGSGASVLEHLLQEHGTIPPDRGLFLDETRRMHPDVCRFVSETIYEGRLHSTPDCADQNLESQGELRGTGIRFIPVEHDANTRKSPEEAEEIARRIEGLADATYRTARDETRALRAHDIMVVTPYNAQVRCLREHLPDAVRVGTVDKFQGQEAAVVFFSMATSSGEEIPRNIEFLFSRNRLNVAVSRARCLAVLVCSPQLFAVRCRNAEQMRLVNALCRLAEVGDRLTPLAVDSH